MKTLQQTRKEFDSKVMGFNDRGIVEYDEANSFAHCLNCGKTLKGPLANEWMFGHKGCEKPNGAYIPNDMTPEKLWSWFESTLSSLTEQMIPEERDWLDDTRRIYFNEAVREMKENRTKLLK